MHLQGFAPLLPAQPKVLVLGSAPSVESLKQQKYYGHPRNAFWPIMEHTLGYPLGQGYEQRQQMLKDNHIALWDVVGSAYREGSLDSSFDPASLVLNPVDQLLQQYPSIEKVLINGTFAYDTFKKHFGPQPWFKQREQDIIKMPSTSPANASQSFTQKLEKWKSQIQPVLNPASGAPR